MSSEELTGRHVRAARALLSWSQAELAAASGVSLPTIKRMEVTDGPLGGRTATIAAVRTALEAAGITFHNGGAPGVQLRRN